VTGRQAMQPERHPVHSTVLKVVTY